NRVQGLRRSHGLDVTDRIVLRWNCPDDDIAEAFSRHESFIAGEVLATEIVADASGATERVDIAGSSVGLGIGKIE
ncbi:hypothetical protein MNBD_ACTINO01-1918, partial [hydrothermal vent metagenome]